ncbi:MAG: hypothetical protein IIB61_08010, partial [Planctomycetes bacterium]|nr:hypothetical protein [Planctomycetota bacterium]
MAAVLRDRRADAAAGDGRVLSRVAADGQTDRESLGWAGRGFQTDRRARLNVRLVLWWRSEWRCRCRCWNDRRSGFGKGDRKTFVLVYTSAGRPFSQSISYSNDRGRTWTRYEDNPVVPNQGLMATERDPRVFWHEPKKKR